MIQLVLSLLALIAGAVFTLFVPGTGLETTIISLVGALAGAFGVTNWREKYDAAKAWFQSKSIVGAVLVALAVVAVVVLPLFTTVSPALSTILDIIIVGGGGTSLYGIFDIIQKSTAKKL